MGRGQGEGLTNQIAESLQEDPFCTKSIDFGKRRQVRDDRYVYNFAKPCHRALIARSAPKLRKVAFTLAEVLITLGIIGVVAALTIQTLIQNHKKIVIATQLKQSYSILYNAIKMSEVENENFTEWRTPTNSPSSTKIFAESYILPYLKYTETGKDNFFYPNEELFYFKLANGSIVALHVGSCLDFLVDVNGNKKPNREGVDQFTFYLNIFQSQTFPNGFSTGVKRNSRTQVRQICTNSPRACAKLIEYDNWEIKNDYPHRI